MKKYGDLIQSLRRERGLSRSELAQKAGLSEFEVARLESWYNCYSPYANLALAKGLNYPVAKLLKAGSCIDYYQDEEHVRSVFEGMNVEKNINSSLHIASVDGMTSEDFEEMKRSILEILDKEKEKQKD